MVEDNHLEKNSTGIIALNSEHLLIRGNRILHAMDASGAGIALKETSAAIVVDNEIVHCAHGLMADSPMDPYNRIVMVNNLFAHNLTAIYFYGAFGGHIAIANTFRNNLWPVSIVGDGDPMNDLWLANYWDDYQGFDRNHDGYGDWPHELLVFADRLWMEIPATKFFRNAIVLELLTFLNGWRRSPHPCSSCMTPHHACSRGAAGKKASGATCKEKPARTERAGIDTACAPPGSRQYAWVSTSAANARSLPVYLPARQKQCEADIAFTSRTETGARRR